MKLNDQERHALQRTLCDLYPQSEGMIVADLLRETGGPRQTRQRLLHLLEQAATGEETSAEELLRQAALFGLLLGRGQPVGAPVVQ